MKFMHCTRCGDVLMLLEQKRHCGCGRIWGYYSKHHKPTISRHAKFAIIPTRDFLRALSDHLKKGEKKRVNMFLLPNEYHNLKVVM